MVPSERTINEFNLPRYYPHEDFHRKSSHKRKERRRLHEKPRQDRDPAFSPSTLYSLTSYRRPPSLLKAALLNDSSSPGKSNRDDRRRRKLGTDKKGPGWHRKIFGKMPWRRESDGLRGGSKSSSSSLTSSTMEHEEIMLVESFAVYENAHQDLDNDFMVQYFETSATDQVLPVVRVEPRHKNKFKSTQQSSSVLTKKSGSIPKSPTIDSEYFDVSIKQASPPQETTRDTFSSTDGKRGVICRVLQNMLTERISERWTSEAPEGLNINIRSSSDNYNNIGRLLLKGRYRADATLSSNRIVFDNIRFSSIRAEMEQVTLNLMGFFSNDNDNNQNPRKRKKKEQNEDQNSPGGRPSNTYSSSMPTKTTGTVRYPKQFDIHIEDLTMSRHDLLFSSCVRNGLRRLLIRLLKDRGLRSDSIRITSIDILVSRNALCKEKSSYHRLSLKLTHRLSSRFHLLCSSLMERYLAWAKQRPILRPHHPSALKSGPEFRSATKAMF